MRKGKREEKRERLVLGGYPEAREFSFQDRRRKKEEIHVKVERERKRIEREIDDHRECMYVIFIILFDFSPGSRLLLDLS